MRSKLPVLAGVLAVLSSLTALSAIVWSDVAHANPAPIEVLSDELEPSPPVEMTKIKVLPEPKPDPLFGFGGVLNAGTFEGY